MLFQLEKFRKTCNNLVENIKSIAQIIFSLVYIILRKLYLKFKISTND